MRKLLGLLLALCAAFPAYAQNFYPPRVQPQPAYGGYSTPQQVYGQHVANAGRTGTHYGKPAATKPTLSLTAEELKLYNMINAYRREKNLPAIALSPSLSKVAQAHVRDLSMNTPHNRSCNMHSWSAKGPWSPVCYTDDHKNANGMWTKPREIAGYRGLGYEIAMGGWGFGGYRATAEDALRGWKRSHGHNTMIVNQSIWTTSKWKALGVGIYQGYAVAWFGEEADSVPVNLAVN